jgi:hypothetical protein
MSLPIGVIQLTKPNEYVLGGTIALRAKFTNDAGTGVTPSEARISVKEPSGTVLTISGGELTPSTTISGMSFYMYRPPTVGWFEYESWGKDGNGNEVVQTNGFEIIDRIIPT